MENYKDKLTEFIEEFWRKELPILKERKVKLDLETELINDVIGVRRSGKTSVMLLTISRLGKERCLYLNFENRKLFPLTNKYFDAIIEFIYGMELLKRFKKIYLFLDEVQKINEWERYVRSIYDEFKGRIKIFISGSTSKLTASKLSTLLSGRHLTTYVFPLSFREFLSFKEFKIPTFYIEEDRAKVLKFLKEYIEFGGFPEVVLSEKKEEMIQTLMLDIINRDVLPGIVKRREIVEDFVYFLCSNSGKLLSFNEMAKLFVRTSVLTVQKIFNLLKDVFLFFDFPIFSYSVKTQLLYPKKIICIDQGFINQFGFKFSEDRGRLMENLVGIELLRKYGLIGKTKVFYWKEYGKREGSEVDFVLKEGLNVKQLIQVTYASSKDEIDKREVRALMKASEQLKCKNLLIITWDYEDELKVDSRKIKCVPLGKWLLELKEV
ncbi:MAG: ATP-binding protein [Candidatus Aenigmatarchaeota archaeon]